MAGAKGMKVFSLVTGRHGDAGARCDDRAAIHAGEPRPAPMLVNVAAASRFR